MAVPIEHPGQARGRVESEVSCEGCEGFGNGKGAGSSKSKQQPPPASSSTRAISAPGQQAAHKRRLVRGVVRRTGFSLRAAADRFPWCLSSTRNAFCRPEVSTRGTITRGAGGCNCCGPCGLVLLAVTGMHVRDAPAVPSGSGRLGGPGQLGVGFRAGVRVGFSR